MEDVVKTAKVLGLLVRNWNRVRGWFGIDFRLEGVF
jgi:hypothetical protein